MLPFQRLKNSFWRVPLVAMIAGLLYTPCYVRIVTRFGVIEPGVIDDRVSFLTSAFLMIATLILGWVILLRKQTRAEIFVSSSIVVGYGLLLEAVQFLSGSTTGPAAVVFMHLATPLEWMALPTVLGLYLQEHSTTAISFFGFLHFFVPWLFILFGRKNPAKLPKQ